MSWYWTHETRMSNISQVNWEKQGSSATLSDTESEIDSDDSDDERILSAFTASVDLTEGIVEAVDEEEGLGGIQI